MAKYRKKPIVIEAFQYDGDFMNNLGKYYIPMWLIEQHEKGVVYFDEDHVHGGSPYNLFIKTLEGVMRVDVGDYIIKGIDGELYPCKPDIFEKTYETVE